MGILITMPTKKKSTSSTKRKVTAKSTAKKRPRQSSFWQKLSSSIYLSKNKNGNPRAFSMVELMVVLAILLILIIITTIVFRRFLVYGKDGRKKSDIDKMRIALENYAGDFSVYPDPVTMASCNSNGLRPYLDKIPCVKNGNVYQPYLYIRSDDGLSYSLYTILENEDDQAIIQVNCQDGCGPDIDGDGVQDYNYGIGGGNLLFDQIPYPDIASLSLFFPTPTPSMAATNTPTNTPVATATPVPAPTTAPPTSTPIPTFTPSPVPTATNTPTSTPVPTATATLTPTSTPSPSPTPQAVPTSMPVSFSYGTTPPSYSCPAGMQQIGTARAAVLVREIDTHLHNPPQVDHELSYSYSLPRSGHVMVVGYAMQGHPDAGCPNLPPGSPYGQSVCRKQNNESFNILMNGSQQVYFPDYGDDHWVTFGYYLGTFSAGSNSLTFRHSNENSTDQTYRSSPGSVDYNAVLCLQ